ncbi:tRNA pseudouridine(55) synthase TruB [Candidatus Saccharibacteria bacterium]|nr:tRNA pseudouridine(55) synthase TruB [Candidatus Saccharibacteria bacterium]
MDEILLIDKPAGMSSFGVVARVRRQLSQQVGHKVKVGHTGTLDPFATGLLILLVGKATKRSGEFLKLDKWYEATIRLGYVSTTGDVEGEISEVSDKGVSADEIEIVLKKFTGEILQKVPRYSAVKINGRRAYDLARKGIEVEMPRRKVTIYALELVSYKWPELKIKCNVSSGTYIRALGEDIGEELGVGGYLTELRRTRIGDYKIEDATSLAGEG